MSSVISFASVSVKRGKREVLKNINLDLPSGQIIGLLGPSGAGKSTIMRAIVDVQSNVSGRVEVLGGLAGSRQSLTRVAYSTQSSSVFDDLTIAQNLRYACRMLGVSTSRVGEVLEQVHLTDHAKQKVRALSGGQRSRVSLAMALVGDPDILVLDEPTVGLDPVLRADLWGIFRQLAAAGKTLIVSSHVMDEAERCDRIVFVRDGAIIADDTLENVLKATSTDSAEKAFLALARSAA